jgi:hypothetical protein
MGLVRYGLGPDGESRARSGIDLVGLGVGAGGVGSGGADAATPDGGESGVAVDSDAAWNQLGQAGYHRMDRVDFRFSLAGVK